MITLALLIALAQTTPETRLERAIVAVESQGHTLFACPVDEDRRRRILLVLSEVEHVRHPRGIDLDRDPGGDAGGVGDRTQGRQRGVHHAPTQAGPMADAGGGGRAGHRTAGRGQGVGADRLRSWQPRQRDHRLSALDARRLRWAARILSRRCHWTVSGAGGRGRWQVVPIGWMAAGQHWGVPRWMRYGAGGERGEVLDLQARELHQGLVALPSRPAHPRLLVHRLGAVWPLLHRLAHVPSIGQAAGRAVLARWLRRCRGDVGCALRRYSGGGYGPRGDEYMRRIRAAGGE